MMGFEGDGPLDGIGEGSAASREQLDRSAGAVFREKAIFAVFSHFAARLMDLESKEDLAWFVAREVVGKLEFDDCVIYYLNAEGSHLRQAAAIGEEKNPESNEIANLLTIPMGQGITGSVAQSGRPIIVDDLEHDSRYIPDINAARSEICVPLIVDGRIYGVIDCEDPRPGHFSKDHLNVLTTVADLAGVKLKLLEQDKTLEMAEHLREAETRFSDVGELTSDWFWERDAEGRLTFVSEGMESIAGIKPEDALGKSPSAFTVEGAGDMAAAQALNDILDRKEAFRDFQQRYRRSDGTVGWVSISGKPVYDREGNFAGYRGASTEISKLKAAQENLEQAHRELEKRVQDRTQELRHSRDLLQRVTDSLPAMISYIDALERYTLVNVAWETFVGLHRDDVVGRKMVEVINPRHHELASPLVKRALAGERFATPLSISRGDGERRDVEANFVPDVDKDGNVNGVIVLVQDFTEKHRAENQLIQADKLATLGTLAAGTAHELSQPLNIIRLAVDSLLFDLDEAETTTTVETADLQGIVAQVLRMAEIIDHMKIFSRQNDPPSETFVPIDSIDGALGLVRSQFAAVDVKVVAAVPADCAPIKGSRSRLEQVILNLLSNAKDAIAGRAGNGDIDAQDLQGLIEVSLVENAQLGTIEIAVADNGGGIDPTSMNNVFDPFYTTKEIGKGTGLGLSVSHSIIDGMGGTLTGENTDVGARFTISLPYAD